jgi:hypothetical protein
MIKVVKLLKGHAKALHRTEHLGNMIILAAVSMGIHEIETLVSGGLAVYIGVVVLLGEDEA